MKPSAPLSADEARAWMEAMAPVVGLEIPESRRDGVVAQLVLNHELVAPLLAFELPVGGAGTPAPQR